jgi:CheY-like chemotaxis protein
VKLLFIDDDRRRMTKYVDELIENGYEVVFEDNVDLALATLRSHKDVDLVVLDISMPPGAEYKFEDTVGGTRTGLALYDTIRTERPELRIVALTNVPDPRVAEHFARDNASLWRLVRKPDVLPRQFAEFVGQFLTGKGGEEAHDCCRQA